jgi:hypothetical protein
VLMVKRLLLLRNTLRKSRNFKFLENRKSLLIN